MRTLKFRYWNTITKEMVNNPKMPYKENWTIEQLFEDRGWVWMQFTGLTDRHGVEIYEGDILSTDRGKYYIKEALPFLLLVDKDNYEYDNGDYYQGGDIQSHSWPEFEVIGNIYENKDLL